MKHQHHVSYGERMNFPYLPPLKFNSLTPLVYVFSSLSALLKLVRSPLPSQKHTCYIKCLHHNTNSQNLIFPIDLSINILMRFLFTISLKFPHSSYSFPLVSSSTLLFTYLSYLFSVSLKLPRRIVPPLTAGTCLPIPCTLNHSFISILDTSSRLQSHN